MVHINVENSVRYEDNYMISISCKFGHTSCVGNLGTTYVGNLGTTSVGNLRKVRENIKALAMKSKRHTSAVRGKSINCLTNFAAKLGRWKEHFRNYHQIPNLNIPFCAIFAPVFPSSSPKIFPYSHHL